MTLYDQSGYVASIQVESGPTTAPGVKSDWRFWHTFSINTASGDVAVYNQVYRLNHSVHAVTTHITLDHVQSHALGRRRPGRGLWQRLLIC